MMELARPTMNKKLALTAAPGRTHISAAYINSERRRSGEGARRTYDSAHRTDAVDVVVDVRADGDGDVLSWDAFTCV